MRRRFQEQMVQDRASRNMRAIRRMGGKEIYLRGIGQGIVFLLISLVILGLNIQNAGQPSFIADLQALPSWVWVFGGGIGSFGLCWAIRNAWQFVSFIKHKGRILDDGSVPDRATPGV